MELAPNSLSFLFLWVVIFLCGSLIGSKVWPQRFHRDTLVPAFLFLAALHILYLSSSFEALPGETSAGTIPAAVAAFLSLFAFMQSVSEQRANPKIKSEQPASSQHLIVALLTLCYLVLIPRAGFYVSSLLFLAGCFLVLGARKIPAVLVIASAWCLVVFALFSSVLQIPLPTGALF